MSEAKIGYIVFMVCAVFLIGFVTLIAFKGIESGVEKERARIEAGLVQHQKIGASGTYWALPKSE